MKTLTTTFESSDQLYRFIKENHIDIEQNILIQIFTSYKQKSSIENLINFIDNIIPKCKIIGSSTNGEISNIGAQTNSTVISFSIFKNTKIKTVFLEYDQSSFISGQKMINSFEQNKELKLLISFTDGIYTNGENYLKGIYSINKDVVVSGGMAGDYSKFKETFVFTKDGITNKGMVAAALYNEDLNIFTSYSFNWESIGKKHIVTKSDNNRVYEIANMSAVDFYKYYLGNDIEKHLPSIGIEFPLVVKKDGISTARAVIKNHQDGSLSFAGNVEQGSVIQFGHGNVQMIINKSLENVKKIVSEPVESIFIYSCLARLALLKEDINLEIVPLRELSSISGFFTNGEFFNNNQNSSFLNQSMTILAISETKKMTKCVTPNIFNYKLPHQQDDVNLYRTQAFSTLIEQTTKDLEEFNTQLKQKVDEEVKKNEQKDTLLHMMKTQSQIAEMLEMIIHQWRQPISAITTTLSSVEVYNDTDLLTSELLENSINHIKDCTLHLDSTINDFRTLFKGDLSLEIVDAKSVIKKTLIIIKSLLIKNKIKLIKNCDISAKVEVSTGLLMQVLLNILKNGVDILMEKDIQTPQIEIQTKIKDDKLLINIKDNAGGIPDHILPKVFDKGFTTKDFKTGTGIGLHMSKSIIEGNFEGKLYASNQHPWAIFTIELPIKK